MGKGTYRSLPAQTPPTFLDDTTGIRDGPNAIRLLLGAGLNRVFGSLTLVSASDCYIRVGQCAAQFRIWIHHSLQPERWFYS